MNPKNKTSLQKKKRIVFVTLAVGPYNRTFFNGLNEKIKSWAEIYIIYYSGYSKLVPSDISKDIHLIPADGINVLNSKLIKSAVNSPDSLIHYFFRYKNLNKTLEEISPDIVQTTLYFMPYSWQVSAYCRKKHIPLLSYEESQREPHFILTRTLNRMGLLFLRKTMIKNIKYLISPTRQGVAFQSKFLADKNRVVHVPWPVKDKELLAQKRIDSRSNKLRLLVVARLVPYKNYDTILDALIMLKKKKADDQKTNYQKIDYHLTIIGFGPLEEHIKQRINENGLQKNITIVPKVKYDEMKDYYVKTDILLLVSTYESYGVVIPESMACGCGIIVSDTCGAEFMVESGKNGYKCITGDAEDLANKITLCVGKTKRFSEHSRLLMRTKFSTETIVNNYLKLLKQAGM